MKLEFHASSIRFDEGHIGFSVTSALSFSRCDYDQDSGLRG